MSNSKTPESVLDLIPKDKFDVDSVSRLSLYSYEEIKQIVPDLLEWLQDGNWPVAFPLGNYLAGLTEHITPEIIKVFRGNDSLWKYWCLIYFGKSAWMYPLLMQEIQALARRVTVDEIENDVLQQARMIIAGKSE